MGATPTPAVAEPDLGGLKLSFSEWRDRVETNRARGLPEIEPVVWAGKLPPMCICASGPSLKEHLGALRRMRKKGASLMAVNRAYPFLLRHGVTPDLFAMFDPDEHMVETVDKPSHHTLHLIASQAHPKVFDALQGKKVALWHAWCAGFVWSKDGQTNIGDDAERWHDEWGVRHVMCMGSHIGLHAMALATFLGHFDLHLFGFDGCLRSSGAYAFKQRRDNTDQVEIDYEGRKYTLDPPLMLQAQEFSTVAKISKHRFNATFHGHGLLSAIWQKEAA